jgi:hypothetical protein
MKKWKYFSSKDEKRETVGVLYAEDENEAYAIACKMKRLSNKKFRELFKVERYG